MHLEPSEARILFHCVDYALMNRSLQGRTIPAEAATLRARLESAVRASLAVPGEELTGDVIGVREAARLLHCAERHVRRLAPEMGGITISGRWVFDREKVEKFARTPRIRRYRKCPRTD